jgi:hypothetical protein
MGFRYPHIWIPNMRWMTMVTSKIEVAWPWHRLNPPKIITTSRIRIEASETCFYIFSNGLHNTGVPNTSSMCDMFLSEMVTMVISRIPGVHHGTSHGTRRWKIAICIHHLGNLEPIVIFWDMFGARDPLSQIWSKSKIIRNNLWL